MLHERLSDVAAAEREPDDVGRQDALGELDDARRRERRLGGRLDHGRHPGRQRGSEVAQEEQHRRVPGTMNPVTPTGSRSTYAIEPSGSGPA